MKIIEMLQALKDEGEIVWGFDSDGDFGIKIGGAFLSMYKWSDPTIQPLEYAKPTFLNDANSKDMWRYLMSYKGGE